MIPTSAAESGTWLSAQHTRDPDTGNERSPDPVRSHKPVKPFGIRVTIVDPGAVESALWEKGRAQMQAILDAASPELLQLYAPLIEVGKRLGENPRDILPASCVVKDVVHALTSSNPKPRYLVGPGTEKAAKLARMPVWLRDWLLNKFMRSGVERGRRGAVSVEQRVAV